MEDYFKDASICINSCNNTFLKEKGPDFEDKFQDMLIHLDTETNVSIKGIKNEIYQAMNKQYMVINDQNKLESLFPAAAYAFSKMKEPDRTERNVSRILERPDDYSYDTIGRLLARYVILQLKKNVNIGKEFKIKYFNDKAEEGEFTLKYVKIVPIRLGTIVPQRTFENTLFIPEDPTYRYVDLLYHDAQQHMLYPIQITTSLATHKNSHRDFQANFFSLWQHEFSQDTGDNRILKMQFIWMGGEWNPQSLFAQRICTPIESQTTDSWTVGYKQIPYELFRLSKKNPKIEMAKKDSKQLPKQFQVDDFKDLINARSNVALDTFVNRTKKYFSSQLEKFKGKIEIEYFKQDIKNMYYLKILLAYKHLLERMALQFFTVAIRMM